MSHSYKYKKRTRSVGSANRQAKWSRAVRKRDNYTCNICLATTELTAHHLNSKDVQQQYSLDNGICLCAACHHRFHQSHRQSHKYQTKPCTASQYETYRIKTIEKYARKQGRAAFHAGLTRADNPYTNTEHYVFWDLAFRFEERQTMYQSYKEYIQ